MRVLRIYPTANDLRHRRRDLELQQLGVDVAIVAPTAYGPDWAPTPIEPDLRHWRSGLALRNSIPFHLWNPLALRHAVRRFAPDLVDVHEEPYFPAGLQGAAAAGGRPLVMQTCQNIPKRLPVPVRAARRWVFGRVGGFYPCSAAAANVLRSWGYRGRARVIPYGVEDELFDVRPSGDRIGFVGSLVPQKGIADLLQFGRRLLCVGAGPLAGDVRAAGGEVTTARSADELAEQLERMAVLVMPSRTVANWKEQFGRAAAEGMAAGVPVVAYDSGALPEVIGDAGVLVREGDRDGLARSVESVLAAPDGLGERGRTRASERYRWRVVAREMLALYQEVAAA
jgi:glycosyltransferase involved in cell wall biosynthesis